MPIPVQCPHCGAAHQVPDQMAGKRAKCKCGNAIQIPAPAQQMPAQQMPAQQVPQQQMPAQQQVPQQQAPQQQQWPSSQAPAPAPVAPTQPQLPMSANSAFAGMEDDEMDDLFGKSAETLAMEAAQAGTPEKKAVPKNLVGAGDDEPSKKNEEEVIEVSAGDKAYYILCIIAGVLVEPFAGFLTFWFGLASLVWYALFMAAVGEGAGLVIYVTLVPAVACVGILLSSVGLLAVGGGLITLGATGLRGKPASVDWARRAGLPSTMFLILSVSFLFLSIVAYGVILKAEDFADKIAPPNAQGPVEEEDYEYEYKLDAIFFAAMESLGYAVLISIIPIFCAVLTQKIPPPKPKEDDDEF